MAISKTSLKPSIVWHYPHLMFWQGGTKFVYEIASRLKGSEAILCNRSPIENIKKFEDNGIKVKSTLFINTNSIVYWMLFPLCLLLDLLASFKHLNQADVVVAVYVPSNIVCAIWSRIKKRKYYYYCYEPFAYFHNKEYINEFPPYKSLSLKILSLLFSRLEKWAVKQATKVFTLNQITQRAIKKVYDVDSIVSLMGVDSDHFHPFTEKSITPGNELVITHSTDYSEMKRTDLAIRAFAIVVKKHPNTRLYITTTQPNSPEKSKYEKMANKLNVKDKIIFLGFVSYDELPRYYSDSICYLSCSYDDMFGTTSSNLPVKEAMACGTPAIRANITTEDVEDGISGYLVDPRNTDEIAKKILYLIKRPDLAKKMGLEGRKKIKKLYKWDKVVDSIIKNIN